MYQNKRMLHSSVMLAIALFIAVTTGGCNGQAAGGSTDLVPVLCHRELGVGLLFVTIENRGSDAGPSTMTLSYKSASSLVPRVQLQVKTPGIPAGVDIWIAVELPPAPGAAGFIVPAGKITITVDAMHVPPETRGANHTLVTYCKDGR